jgi:hypothetical protein
MTSLFEDDDSMMGSKAFESPLISNVRMRALYRALVETRVLGERASKGRGAIGGWPRNLEACWVATAIDLKPGDLTSLARGWWLLEHVRALGERATAQAATTSEVRYAVRALVTEKAAPSKVAPLDRLLGAVGMALAAKSRDEHEVAVGYLANDDLTPAEWKRLLSVAAEGELPLILVATPGKTDVSDFVKRTGLKSVPVIPVDAGDMVAIYRVMQETLVRARADGGVAVIECVDCGADPVKLMASQLVKKQICTEKWISGVEVQSRAASARA